MDYTIKRHRVFRDIRVDPLTGCREWTGYQLDSGYGQVGYEGKSWRVHRLVWHLTHGPIPAGAKVLHDCYNRACCNPDHLFLGQRSAGTSLSSLDVRWIRSWARSGFTEEAIANAFGLSITSVRDLTEGLRQKRVP